MWFNTKYYHLLYQHRNDTEAQLFINNLANYLQIDQIDYQRILDLACGKGRHAIYLAQQFPLLDIVGLDLAADSIAQAQQQAKGLNNCFFAVHNILTSLDNYAKFNYIFNLFTSFGYFDTDDLHLQILKNVRAALAENGFFVLDYMNADKVAKNLVPADYQQVGRINFHIERKIEAGFIRKYIRVEDPQHEAGAIQFSEQVRAYSLADFEQLFAAAGLKIRAVFGDYDLNSFDPAQSPRLILVAQR
jgi:SAM-dependent methyltransferase